MLSTLEHHANIVPWQMIAREKGAVMKIIPVTDRGEIMLEAYQMLLGPRTKLVALSHASTAGHALAGRRNDADGQALRRSRVDRRGRPCARSGQRAQLGSDFYRLLRAQDFRADRHRRRLRQRRTLEIMPPWQGGGSMIRNVTFEETTYADPPAKFEAGTPNIADAIGLGARSITSAASACRISPDTNMNY